jgi:GTP-binding protein
VVVADIPGLIEGAHEGTGLGHRFLGHIERCGILIHLIDGTQENVVEAYETIQEELRAYDEGLYGKPQLLALNKCDALMEEEIAEKVKALEQASRSQVFAISALARTNVTELLRACMPWVKEKKQQG